MTKPNNWYVITGAPSSGKSTIINRLAELGFKIHEEVGKAYIDKELSAGKTLEEINVASPTFDITCAEIQHNSEALLNPTNLIIFDRGMLDALGYFTYYKWPIPQNLRDWCDASSYKKVFLFELLDYNKDYFRVEDVETALGLQEVFRQVYQDAGYDIITVPPDSVENRLALVLKHIKS